VLLAGAQGGQQARRTGDTMTSDRQDAKHILVVNDDPAILSLFQELLEEEGYTVTLDKFGRQTGELLEAIRVMKPDLVIMDFIIGHEDSGWQLLQAAKMDRETRDIPVIVCTGAVRQVTDLSQHLDAMQVHVVLKPFDIDHLLEVIAKTWASLENPTPGLDTIPLKTKEDAASPEDPSED
jgi:CheY-like chemotaxis protein